MNPIITFRQGDILSFNYKNHRGKDSTRTVRFEGLDYGRNDWYPTPGWFMRTWDLERQQARSFRFENMTAPPVLLHEGPESKILNHYGSITYYTKDQLNQPKERFGEDMDD